MSDRYALFVVGALVVALQSPVVGAQDPRVTALEMARLVERSRVEEAAADTNRRELIETRNGQRTLSFVAGGQAVRFARRELSDQDTAAIADGLRRAFERLEERFGESGGRLVGHDTLILYGPRETYGVGSTLRSRLFSALRIGRWVGRAEVMETCLAGPDRGTFGCARYDLRYPPRAEDVERMALRTAGARLPSLRDFATGQVSLADEPDRWSEAARELSLSWASPGRRCIVGALGACEAVMTAWDGVGVAPEWIDPSDARSAVTVAELPVHSDSALVADKRECQRSDDAACDRVLLRVRLPDPYSRKLRGTLVMHALDVGGSGSIGRLAANPTAAPLARLAHAAELTPDSLLSSWRSRATTALEESRTGTWPDAFSTLIWSTLLLGATMRRRP